MMSSLVISESERGAGRSLFSPSSGFIKYSLLSDQGNRDEPKYRIGEHIEGSPNLYIGT